MKPHRPQWTLLGAVIAVVVLAGGCASSRGSGSAGGAPVGSASFGCVDSYALTAFPPAVTADYSDYLYLYGYGYPEDLCSNFGLTAVYYPAPAREVTTVDTRDRHTTTVHRDAVGGGRSDGYGTFTPPSDASFGTGSYSAPAPRMEPSAPAGQTHEPVSVQPRPN